MFSSVIRYLATVKPSHVWTLGQNNSGTTSSSGTGTTRGIAPVNTPLERQTGAGASGIYAMTFNGTTQFVSGNIGAGTFLDNTSGTSGIWFKCTGGTLDQWLHGAQSLTNGPAFVILATSGYLAYWNRGGGGADEHRLTYQVDMRDSQWHSIIVVHSGTSPVMYVDGVAVTTVSAITGAGSTAWWWDNYVAGTSYSLARCTGSTYLTGSLMLPFHTTTVMTSLQVRELHFEGVGSSASAMTRFVRRRVKLLTAPWVPANTSYSYEITVGTTGGYSGYTLEETGAPAGTLTPASDSLDVVSGAQLREIAGSTPAAGSMYVKFEGVGLADSHFSALVYQRHNGGVNTTDDQEFEMLLTSAATISAYTLITSGKSWSWGSQTYRIQATTTSPRNALIVF